MRIIHVTKTSEMPPEIATYVVKCQLYVRDGFYRYTIGYFVNEAKHGDPECYNPKHVNEAKIFDAWLVAQGLSGEVQTGQEILIEHG